MIIIINYYEVGRYLQTYYRYNARIHLKSDPLGDSVQQKCNFLNPVTHLGRCCIRSFLIVRASDPAG